MGESRDNSKGFLKQTNVVIVKNKKGQEEIVCGKGIAFKKKSW
mgnify:CR=1 FL=1